MYKREEDGIVLVDQQRCRGWRMCVSSCPYKKVYFNWQTGKAEKCTLCYPRIEAGLPTICSETCVGRIRYLGLILYDADRVEEAASAPHERDLLDAQLNIVLDPNDPQVCAQARRDGIAEDWIEAARRSPVYALALKYRVALPLHPEYRTLPMVWYVPPLSPVMSMIEGQGAQPRAASAAGARAEAQPERSAAPEGRSAAFPRPEGGAQANPDDIFPAIDALRIPVQYLANLLSAGDEAVIRRVLKRLAAMRSYMREKTLQGAGDPAISAGVEMAPVEMEEMYRLLAIARYEDRFVIPPAHTETARHLMAQQGSCGLNFPGGPGGCSVQHADGHGIDNGRFHPIGVPGAGTNGHARDRDKPAEDEGEKGVPAGAAPVSRKILPLPTLKKGAS
jgi:nitrate reductase beta subunit